MACTVQPRSARAFTLNPEDGARNYGQRADADRDMTPEGKCGSTQTDRRGRRCAAQRWVGLGSGA